jgi:hypothetical protein
MSDPVRGTISFTVCGAGIDIAKISLFVFERPPARVRHAREGHRLGNHRLHRGWRYAS